MNRLFLTLLALVTGIVAQVGPAHAAERVGDVAEVGLVEQGGRASLAAKAIAQAARVRGALRLPKARDEIGKGPSAPPIATVRIGIDRARE